MRGLVLVLILFLSLVVQPHAEGIVTVGGDMGTGQPSDCAHAMFIWGEGVLGDTAPSPRTTTMATTYQTFAMETGDPGIHEVYDHTGCFETTGTDLLAVKYTCGDTIPAIIEWEMVYVATGAGNAIGTRMHTMRCTTAPCVDGEEAKPYVHTFHNNTFDHYVPPLVRGELDDLVQNDVVALGGKIISGTPTGTIYSGSMEITEINCGEFEVP